MDETREGVIEESVKRTEMIRQDIFVGVSPHSVAGAIENAWEASKRLARSDSVPERRLFVVAQWATGSNPITEFCVVTIGWPAG